ncbi:MAG TPA: ABC transporter permease [Bacillota bacterium]|nr:ABC transporter permease [Bacillota bacterium]
MENKTINTGHQEPISPPIPAPQAPGAQPVQSVSYWVASWRRFKQNKMAFTGGILIVLLVLLAILAPVIAPYGYDQTHYDHSFEGSSTRFIFGTDDLGRDMLSRILYSLRNALIVAFGAQAITLILGVLLGAIAGFRGGYIDTLIMRFVDIMYAFPTFLFNVILVTVMGRGLFTIFLAIGLVSWAGLARLVRGQILSLKQAEYVEAARAIGAKDSHIIARYLLPNTLGPIIISFTMGIPTAMMAESGLSLLGMGLRPPMPSFGNLLNSGNGMILGFPHLLIWPAIIFAIILLSFNFLGDGLRDALNPRSDV